MTVKQLIERLQEFPETDEVFVLNEDQNDLDEVAVVNKYNGAHDAEAADTLKQVFQIDPDDVVIIQLG